MKRTTWICDRCDKEITGTVYTIKCFAEDATPDPTGRISVETAAQNMRQNMANATRHLCRACKDEITDGVFIV